MAITADVDGIYGPELGKRVAVERSFMLCGAQHSETLLTVTAVLD